MPEVPPILRSKVHFFSHTSKHLTKHLARPFHAHLQHSRKTQTKHSINNLTTPILYPVFRFIFIEQKPSPPFPFSHSWMPNSRCQMPSGSAEAELQVAEMGVENAPNRLSTPKTKLTKRQKNSVVSDGFILFRNKKAPCQRQEAGRESRVSEGVRPLPRPEGSGFGVVFCILDFAVIEICCTFAS